MNEKNCAQANGIDSWAKTDIVKRGVPINSFLSICIAFMQQVRAAVEINSRTKFH